MREEPAKCQCGRIHGKLVFDIRAHKHAKAVVIEHMVGTHAFIDWRAKTVRCMHCNGEVEAKG